MFCDELVGGPTGEAEVVLLEHLAMHNHGWNGVVPSMTPKDPELLLRVATPGGKIQLLKNDNSLNRLRTTW